MKYILTPEEIRNADSIAINQYGIKGEILMENAARSVSDIIDEILLDSEIENPEILLICGSGNNGGDGFAAARHLSNLYHVRVAWIGAKEKMSPETLSNFLILEKIGLDIHHLKDDNDIEQFNFNADLIIDSLIGVGGSEYLQGLVVPILKKVNELDALKIAIDIPSGLNSLTGLAHEDAFIADITLTMFAIKTGMLLNDGLFICGGIYTASLGAPERIVGDLAKNFAFDDSDIAEYLPLRYKISSKFDYGRVLIIAGSEHMPGAAALVSNSAIKIGAGLVYLMSPAIHSALRPEIIPTKLDADSDGLISYSNKNVILEAAEKADVIVIGPGLGYSDELHQLINELIESLSTTTSIILDADAIKAINENTKLNSNILLTPHIGEFSNLIGIPREEIFLNHLELVNKWSKQLECNILLKHVPSLISDGNSTYWNLGGNPGMATAGSGDVLTGIIAGLTAQNMTLTDAASIGAYLHSAAGDSFSEKHSEITLTASDLINELDNILTEE